MRKILFLISIFSLICNSCFSYNIDNVAGHVVAINIDGLPMEALEGNVYVKYDTTSKFKKIKNITPDIFDYVFYVTSSYAGVLFFYPLSSGTIVR